VVRALAYYDMHVLGGELPSSNHAACLKLWLIVWSLTLTIRDSHRSKDSKLTGNT